MLDVADHVPKYLHTVDIHSLPQHMQEMVRKTSLRDEYRMLDYSDGDYCFLVDLKLASEDTTPDAVLVDYIEETVDSSAYPFSQWSHHVPRGTALFEYVEWLLFVRYLVANLPQHVVETNKLAIDIWH